jgi:hypothetical protein
MLSDAQARKLFNRQDRLLTSIERGFRNEVFKEKNRFIREQAERFDVMAQVSDADFEQHMRNLKEIYYKYYKRTIRFFVLDVNEMVRSQQKRDVLKLEQKADLWDNLFTQWVTLRGAAAVQTTASTTRQDIVSIINTAQASEEAVPRNKVVSDMLKLRGVNAFRADTIARTEAGMAASFASVQTAKNISANTGLQLKKRWIPALDERTRFSHASMAGRQGISMDAEFTVAGEKLDRPKDPSGSAGNVINCRCQLVYDSDVI